MPRQPIRAHLRYSIEHEWIDTSATPSRIGITAVAADALGEVVFVDLPEVGAAVQAGEVCGELESTKAVSDLYSPVTGTVVSLNEAAVDDPSVISADPYGEGWLLAVEVTGEGELLSPQEYAERFDADIVEGAEGTEASEASAPPHLAEIGRVPRRYRSCEPIAMRFTTDLGEGTSNRMTGGPVADRFRPAAGLGCAPR